MDLGVFYEVIVPLMEMRGAATICISTPVSTWNFYTELTEIRDDRGELLFDVIKVGMVCDRCAGTEHEADCTHPTSDRPEWKTETSEKVRAIYGHRKTLLMREVMGRVADDENMAFEVRDLKAFFKRKNAKEPHNVVDTLFVALDPNGGASGEGGTGSESAVFSFFLDGSNVVVCFFVFCFFVFCFFVGSHKFDQILHTVDPSFLGFDVGFDVGFGVSNVRRRSYGAFFEETSTRPPFGFNGRNCFFVFE